MPLIVAVVVVTAEATVVMAVGAASLMYCCEMSEACQ